MSEPTRTLADKINKLFQAITDDGREHSNEHVAQAISKTGITISQSYIWQLRKGKKDNPTMRHLQALANFFGVPVAYFFDDAVAGEVDGKLAQMAAEQASVNEAFENGDIKLMAMRAGELSDKGRKQVMDLLDVVYRLEQAEHRD
ncbi:MULTISPECIES: helix-turn-helix domain-containing protein [Streptomyces violaceusniger group]|uniref:Putative XRE family transcriptional regulator n=1 Tax=Streptomyces malaysiensis TaxID=92644 RepID=A0A7X5X2Q4_STRMQ|nr:helix-turn-helix domain-containing protein [Streptomyces malaysiensis]NIY65533.1 putative XRE family transcriptional regulator [Streptomyces malaysiensis]